MAIRRSSEWRTWLSQEERSKISDRVTRILDRCASIFFVVNNISPKRSSRFFDIEWYARRAYDKGVITEAEYLMIVKDTIHAVFPEFPPEEERGQRRKILLEDD